MNKTIYAVIDYKDLTDINESIRVLIVTTEFDEAKKIFDSEYAQSYNPSAIDSLGEETVLCFFRGKRRKNFVSLEEVGCIDENGAHYIFGGLENIQLYNELITKIQRL